MICSRKFPSLESGPKHSPFPPSETGKNKNFQTLLRKESPTTEHTVQLSKFLRYSIEVLPRKELVTEAELASALE